MKRETITWLSYGIALLLLVTTGVGLLYTTGGETFTVTNIYGDQIEMYGDGIYTYNSVLKAGTNKGTDAVMAVVAFAFLLATRKRDKSAVANFLHVGLLTPILYCATSYAFAVTYNRLFLVYLLLFSLSLFTFILSLRQLIIDDNIPQNLLNKKLTGTAAFMMISGCSTLVWLMFIIPSVVTGMPMEIIEIYTTEPTFIIDLGIILPATFICGIMLLKQKRIGYQLVPILLTLLIVVGMCVISQTIAQMSIGIVLPIGQLIGLVGTFVALGLLALILNTKFLRHFS